MKKSKFIVPLITTALLGGCSFAKFNNEGECIYTKCDSSDNGFMIYEKEDAIKIYNGSFNSDGLYSGKGEFYYKDDSKLVAELNMGYAINGIYYVLKNGVQYTILFKDEKINPNKIKSYNFKNEVQYESQAGNFSYVGEMSNLTLQGKGRLYKNNLVFNGNFENEFFKGQISNNEQTKKFEIENTDNSVRYVYKNGLESDILQGHFSKNKFKGVQTKYIKDEEILSYEGFWELEKSPFEYKNFNFEKFVKNGLYKTITPSGKIIKGDFVNDKKEGYFDVYENNRLIGFDYYKNNKKLYYVPLYLEIQSQLQRNDCKYAFPETLNLWTPYKFKNCKDDLYTIEFIDKENKNLLMEMVYNNKKNIIKELIIYDKDKKYKFIKINTRKILESKEYTLEGKAEIYQWIDYDYTLISISNFSIKEMKK